MDVRTQLLQLLRNGLKQASIVTCADWATQYRIMDNPFPGPFSFKYHPWLREMHDPKCNHNVGMKAAQMGYTETMLNTALHAIDKKRWSVLYILPADTPHASDFSASRFNPALELSEHLTNLFSDTKNLGHKRAGSTSLFVRGSRSRAGLKSQPLPVLIFDEYEEMVMANIPLAEERTSGQLEYLIWKISTPSTPLKGIDAEFQHTTKEHFVFDCPHCGRPETLTLDNLIVYGDTIYDPEVKKSYLLCKHCKKPLQHEAKVDFLSTGRWEATQKSDRRGFQIPQFYSSAVAGKPEMLAKAVIASRHDPAAEQELYNSKLGLPVVAKGAQVTDEDIQNCTLAGGVFRKTTYKPKRFITAGIDVGTYLHMVFAEWVEDREGNDPHHRYLKRIINDQKVITFGEAVQLLRQYQVQTFVIDANPERRKANDLCTDFPGRGYMCFYSRGQDKRGIKVEDNRVSVDRTSWLDVTLNRYRNQRVLLPIDVSEEFKGNIKSLIRKYVQDKEVSFEYVNQGPDHYGHADLYSEVAFSIQVGSGEYRPIGNNIL
jgi:hypothetical protein